jgi:regulator of protease activity HflC (stomatin/prohibitin superfamily)
MFEKLFDWIDKGWDYIRPFHCPFAWEKSAILRFGKFSREIGPGYNWKWPFIEYPQDVTTCETTMRLDAQTLTTKDGVGVVAKAMVKYEIAQVEAYVTRVFDAKDVLGDVAMGAVRRVVTNTDYATLMAEPPEKKILDIVRREVDGYGFKVHRITFVDLARVRSIRLITPGPIDLDN